MLSGLYATMKRWRIDPSYFPVSLILPQPARTYRLGEFHEMLGSQQRLKLRGIEAGTGFLHARQITVPQNGLDVRKLTVKTEDEKLHRLLLGWRAGIRDATARRQTALVADTDGMSIIAQGMSTHPLHRTAWINHTFQGNVKMITDVAPTVHHHMVVAQLLQSVSVIAAATAAMHHNHINLSHKPSSSL